MVCVSLACRVTWPGSYIRTFSIHVTYDGLCAWVKVGSYGHSNSVKGIMRRWQDLSKGLIQSPWKSPPRMMTWLRNVVVSVLSAMQAPACFTRSWGRYHAIRRQLCFVLSIPSRANASCLGKCFGNRKCRKVDAHVAVLM